MPLSLFGLKRYCCDKIAGYLVENIIQVLNCIGIYYNYFVIACAGGQIRLVGGIDLTEGRVEICLNREWGTVCDQMWDAMDGSVVCRQLGLVSVGM